MIFQKLSNEVSGLKIGPVVTENSKFCGCFFHPLLSNIYHAYYSNRSKSVPVESVLARASPSLEQLGQDESGN